MSWNPDQYLRFAEPRLRPAVDLLARIALPAPKRVVDLGCGAGNVTRLLAERWPQAQITGVDDSAAMLAKAQQALPSVHWLQAGIAEWAAVQQGMADAPDLIFSNAALQWLPDHGRLFPALLKLLPPGGVLAVQMPRNHAAPSHTMVTETVMAGPWRERLQHVAAHAPVAEPADYFEMLVGAAEPIDIWECEYLQVLHGADPVKEWTKGTWLKQFLDALPPDEAPRFEAEYAERVRAAYPALPDGRTLFPFKRLFIVAQKKA